MESEVLTATHPLPPTAPAAVNGHRVLDEPDAPSAEDRPGPLAASWACRALIAVVAAGMAVIAAIGFAGSYAAVRDLAAEKGFGSFASWVPVGVDAGIVVLLALDLLLCWLRIPYPLLRQTAWLLTAATVAFNAASAWPDALGVGMHAVIPVLFIVAVEAARHAIGRAAAITADKHMDGVRAARWLLAFPSTLRLWRRMKLWELRSYEAAVRLEQDRLVYVARLRAAHGRRWRRKASTEQLLPLKLARYGLPLAEAVDRIPAADAPRAGRTPDAPAPATDTRRPDAPPRAASRDREAGRPRTHHRTPDTPPDAKPDAQPDAIRPADDDARRALLQQLAADGQPPASIRRAAAVLGCRQTKAKQLLAAEGLLTTSPDSSERETTP